MVSKKKKTKKESKNSLQVLFKKISFFGNKILRPPYNFSKLIQKSWNFVITYRNEYSNKSKLNLSVSYFVAIFTVFIALWVKFRLYPQIKLEEIPFLLFIASIMISAWFGGFLPGLFATFLSALAVDYYLLTPGAFSFGHIPEKNILMTGFIVIGALISWLSDELLSTMYQSKKLAKDLEGEKEILQVIMENTDAHLAYLDTKFNFIKVNSAYMKGSGYKEKNLIGFNHFNLFPDTENKKIFEKVRNTGKIVSLKAKPFMFENQPEKGVTYWDWTLTPIKNSSNKTEGLVLSLLDVTKQKRTERRLFLEHTLSCLLSESMTLDDASLKILKVIGENLNWEFGSFWSIDKHKDVLYCTKIWHMENIKVKSFERITQKITFASGVGLPGRVWKTGKAAWITDVIKDKNFPRATAAFKMGLHGAFAFPILHENRVYGVIDFFSHDIRPPDDDLLKMMEIIGRQIGQFIERNQIENALKESDRRFRLIFNETAVGISLVDMSGHLVMTNPVVQKILGYTANELKSKVFIDFTHPDDVNSSWSFFKEMTQGKRDYCQFEKRYFRKDSKLIFIRLTASLFRDINEKPQFIISMMEDITERKKSEESLRRHEQEFKVLVENAPDIISRFNNKIQLDYINPAIEVATGVSVVDFLKKSSTELGIPKEISSYWNESVKKVFKVGKEEIIESYLPNKFGSPRYNQTRLVPEFSKEGKIESVLAISRDITEKKLAEDALRELNNRIRHILESVTDGFFALNNKLQLIYVNSQAERFLHKKREELLSKNILKEFPEINASIFYKKCVEVMQTKIAASFEFFSNENKWFEFRIYSSIDGLSIYFQDITERKNIEERKDEFISIASHELKTPLTSIKGYAQVLRNYLDNFSKKDTIYYLLRMDDQINRLVKIINNLLDVSKIRNNTLDLNEEWFDIDVFVKNVVEDIKRISDKHGITIKGKVGEEVFADKYRISQVLINLISNGIKYSPNSDRIIVNLKKDNSDFIISVKDFGIGISDENKEKIFEKFFRAGDSNGEKSSGLGLGLYICNKIIKLYKGKIWVESKLGKGSSFYFTLPINKDRIKINKKSYRRII